MIILLSILLGSLGGWFLSVSSFVALWGYLSYKDDQPSQPCIRISEGEDDD